MQWFFFLLTFVLVLFFFLLLLLLLLLRCDEEGKKKTTAVVWEGAMAFAGTQQKCKACEKTVYLVEQLTADGVIYHKSCFRCNHCKGTLKVRPALVSASVSLSLFSFLSSFCVFCYVMCCCCVVVVVSSVRSGSRTQWQSFCIVESLLHPLVAIAIVNGSRQRFRSL